MGSLLMSDPLKIIFPDVSSLIPIISLARVVLPDPLGPVMA